MTDLSKKTAEPQPTQEQIEESFRGVLEDVIAYCKAVSELCDDHVPSLIEISELALGNAAQLRFILNLMNKARGQKK